MKNRAIMQIQRKFSISPGTQDILLKSTRCLKGKQALSPWVIEILQFNWRISNCWISVYAISRKTM